MRFEDGGLERFPIEIEIDEDLYERLVNYAEAHHLELEEAIEGILVGYVAQLEGSA